jgi:glycosyltransferase involved in cell wall biosynthesis
MLLIDAAQINQGGALVLLNTLIEQLKDKQIDFLLIKDSRLTNLNLEEIKYVEFKYFKFKRKFYYKKLIKKYPIRKVLCFYNFPPPINLHNITVFTYFHNLNLFSDSDLSSFPIWFQISIFIKRVYLKKTILNSEYFVFQTDYLAKKFSTEFCVNKSICLKYPFFDERQIDNYVSKYQMINRKFNFCYISVPYAHKNHFNLFQAFIKLANEKNLYPSLVVTVPINSPIYSLMMEAILAGIKIINLEYASYETCLHYTAQSEICIFPSISESLGLGLVEAQKLGLNVITSNIPVLTEVINASLTFDPYSVEDIYMKILQALEGDLNKPELLIKNCIIEFSELLA